MIIFILLTCAASFLSRYEELAFIKNTFLIISIILLAVNSIKISWIAFLVKKEKISLLVLSVIITALFIVNLVNSSSGNVHNQVLSGFSASLDQFLNLMMIYGVVYFSILFFTTLFHIPTAEAFDRKAQEVSSLQVFSRLITEVLDIDDLGDTVTDIALKICNADAAWIILQQNEDLKVKAQKNIGFVDAGILSNYIIARKKADGIGSTDIYKIDKLFEHHKLNEKYFSIIAAPLKIGNETMGFLAAAKKGNFLFDEDDKQAVITFSDYANVAFENSRLLEESIVKERLEKELDVAREVQKKLLPEKSPVLEKLDISSVFIPAFEVGGDYYDFFDISDSKLGFVIADVSGKGISAAFIMAEIKGIFESLSHTGNRPREILIKANEILKRTLDRKTFISAAYGIFDLENNTLNISRAGHCPILLLRGGKIENLKPKGIGLGLVYGTQFEETLDELEFTLEENDIIVLFTDGITEAKNTEMEDFGTLVFEQILLENKEQSAERISEKVIREVTLFSKNNPQHDDITLVILKWKQKNNLVGVNEWQNSTPQLNNQVM
jgi:serine phosphatase RsbU (regulator of sigma subunit)